MTVVLAALAAGLEAKRSVASPGIGVELPVQDYLFDGVLLFPYHDLGRTVPSTSSASGDKKKKYCKHER